VASCNRKTVVVLDKVKRKELNSRVLSTTRWFGISLGVVLLLMHAFMTGPAGAQTGGNPGVFFSQGQAIYHPQDPSKSQHEAIQDLQAQGVIQAAAALLSPAHLGNQVQIIQEKVLKQQERFVRTYEIFSETPNQNGLYRVTGQVSVAMDKLRMELALLGLASSETETVNASIAQPASKSSPSDEAATEPDKPLDKTDKAMVSGKEILWAVVENWDDEWHLPGNRKDPKGLFAACVAQGSGDYGWSIRFPQVGTLAPDANGEVPASRVLAQARELGLPHVVIGTLALVQSDNGEGRLQAAARLLSVSSGKAQGEIHRELAIGDSSNQEAALELADLIIPQLDRQLREPSPSRPATESTVKPSEAGVVVLQIKSNDAYADWLVLEKTLREQFKSMQVKGFEIRPEQSVVRLEGVDETSLRNVHGTRLSNGAQVQIENFDEDNHAFAVTFKRSSSGPAEPRQ
jgi:hypothetical protein